MLTCHDCGTATDDHAPKGRRCRPCDAARSRRYYAKNRADVLRRQTGEFSSRYRMYRDRAIALMGGECENCGTDATLQVDHVRGDGKQHRAVETKYMMMKRIVDGGGAHPDYDLRLLCEPCHRRIGHSGFHCPGCRC